MRFFRKSEALGALATIDHSDYSGLEEKYWGRCVTFPFTLTERQAKAALYCAHRAITVRPSHLIDPSKLACVSLGMAPVLVPYRPSSEHILIVRVP